MILDVIATIQERRIEHVILELLIMLQDLFHPETGLVIEFDTPFVMPAQDVVDGRRLRPLDRVRVGLRLRHLEDRVKRVGAGALNGILDALCCFLVVFFDVDLLQGPPLLHDVGMDAFRATEQFPELLVIHRTKAHPVRPLHPVDQGLRLMGLIELGTQHADALGFPHLIGKVARVCPIRAFFTDDLIPLPDDPLHVERFVGRLVMPVHDIVTIALLGDFPFIGLTEGLTHLPEPFSFHRLTHGDLRRTPFDGKETTEFRDASGAVADTCDAECGSGDDPTLRETTHLLFFRGLIEVELCHPLLSTSLVFLCVDPLHIASSLQSKSPVNRSFSA